MVLRLSDHCILGTTTTIVLSHDRLVSQLLRYDLVVDVEDHELNVLLRLVRWVLAVLLPVFYLDLVVDVYLLL